MATVSRTFSVKNGLDVANTVVIDSNRNISNVGGLNVTTANATTVNATNYFLSNGINLVTQASLGVTTANAAYDQANTARNTANDAYGQANTARDQANTARDQANSAYGQANSAYDQANTAANTVRVSVNSASTLSNKQLNFVNTTTALVNVFDSGNGNANISINVVNGTFIGSAYDQANTARDQANAAYDQANAAYADSNTRVLRAGDTMTGNLTVNAFINASNTFVSKKTILQGPSTANTNGERLRLYDFEQAGHPNYAIGVEPNYIWVGTDENNGGTGFRWYGNTTLAAVMLSNGTLQLSNTVEAKILRANGTGTAIDASQGNVLTNQVTGTKFNFLAGANTISLDASGATANYTFNLPANSGLVGQVLATDGTGDTYFTSSPFEASNVAANTVRVSQNSGATLSNKQLNFVNSASVLVNVNDAGDGNANIVFVVSGAAAGDAYDQANAAYAQANAARGQANSAFDTANLKVASISVSGNGLAVSNVTSANINDYTLSVNTASTTLRGTTLLVDTVNSSDTGNAATANAVKTAWDYANTKLSLSGGTLGGSLNISGNLTITGNTKYVNVETYIVTDPLIYLAANNETSDLVDIGFMGGHNTAGVYQHSGLARHAVDGTWYLFTGLAEEGHENNVVDVANTQYALLKANLYAQQLNVVNGFVNVATTLEVGGNTTLSNVVINKDANITGNLTVTGTTLYANVVTYTSAVNVNSTLNVTGTTTLANTNVNGVLTITNSGEGLVVGNANITHTLTVSALEVTTNTVTTSSSGQVVLDTFPLTELASAKYFVQANSGTTYHTTEVIVVHDGTNIFLTEYGSIQTGASLGSFTADIDSGNARLLFTAVNNVNTIRSARYGLIP